MKKIIEARDLPEQEKIYLKKDMFGYRVINPVKNPDGTIKWINLFVGGWRNLFILLLILFIILSFMYGAREMLKDCKDMAENPCKYMDLDCTRYYREPGLVFEGVIPNEPQEGT